MSACPVCLGPGEPHPACLRELFGVARVPTIDLDLAHLHTAGLAMVGRTSLSGVQRKISLGFGADRQTLQVAVERARFVLKPQAGTYPHLPENEHVTMRMAGVFGIPIPPCGLVTLRDGSLAYIVARFDRPPAGGKLRQEDFCQLAGLSPKQKYDGSAELCVRLVRKYASEPVVAVAALYRQLLFAWWTGNGDLHLKNLSLLTGPDGLHRLSPAYDLLCTGLVIEGDPLALPIVGKRTRIDRSDWLGFAEYARLPRRAAERILSLPKETLAEALRLVGASALPDEMKEAYADILAGRAALSGA